MLALVDVEFEAETDPDALVLVLAELPWLAIRDSAGNYLII